MADGSIPEVPQPQPTPAEHQGIWAKIKGAFGSHKPVTSTSPIVPTTEQPMAAPTSPITPEAPTPAAASTPGSTQG